MNSSLSQRTSFYMIGTPVIKKLIGNFCKNLEEKPVFQNLLKLQGKGISGE